MHASSIGTKPPSTPLSMFERPACLFSRNLLPAHHVATYWTREHSCIMVYGVLHHLGIRSIPIRNVQRLLCKDVRAPFTSSIGHFVPPLLRRIIRNPYVPSVKACCARCVTRRSRGTVPKRCTCTSVLCVLRALLVRMTRDHTRCSFSRSDRAAPSR